MATNAERVRRHRAHQRGDHSLCRPERGCATARPEPPPDPAAPPPRPAARAPHPPAPPVPEQYPERSEASQALWDELAPGLGAAHRVLLTQVCRIADRLDRLDGLIDGRHRRGDWLRLTEGEGGEIRVVVDDLLAESRQQAIALKGLVAELRQAGALKPPQAPPAKGGGLADLTARIADRRRAPAG